MGETDTTTTTTQHASQRTHAMAASNVPDGFDGGSNNGQIVFVSADFVELMYRGWIVLVLVEVAALVPRLPETFVVIPLLLIAKDDTGVPIVVVPKAIRNDRDDIFI